MTQRRGELEEGVQQARKLERELTAADKLLTATETSIAALPPPTAAAESPNLQHRNQTLKVTPSLTPIIFILPC